MPAEFFQWYLHLPTFGLVTARIAGLLMFQPLLASLAVPMQIRALLILALAALATPLLPEPVTLPGSWPELAIAIGSELLLGAALGLGLAAVLVGAQIGGLLIAQESGLNFGQIADPASGEDLTPLSMLYLQLATMLLLAVGGHRIVVEAVLNSFVTLPLPGTGGRETDGLDFLLDGMRVSFELAFQIAAPTLIALTMANVVLGLISRTVAQFNVLTVGFALKTLLAFVIMAMSLPAGVHALTDGLEHVLSRIEHMLN